MKASEVREALLGKYPPDKYLSVYEAPLDPSRQGRKLDVVVVALWRSRGFERHGIEIKVSMSDWKRELEGYTDVRGQEHGGPEKAEEWHAHLHRFSVAAPAELARKIKPQLPPGWGLLAIDAGGVKVLVDSEVNRTPEELTWPETIGLLRATADCGANVLSRQHRLGYEKGRADAEAAIARNGGEAAMTPERIQERQAVAELARLREQIKEFEQSSGVEFGSWGALDPAVGRLVRLAREAVRHPAQLDRFLSNHVAGLRDAAEQVQAIRQALGKGTGA